MFDSSGDDCAPSENAVGRQSTTDNPAEPGTASDDEYGEEDKTPRPRMFRECQTLQEFSRAEHDSDEIEDSTYEVARDVIKPKLSVSAYCLLKRKSKR